MLIREVKSKAIDAVIAKEIVSGINAVVKATDLFNSKCGNCSIFLFNLSFKVSKTTQNDFQVKKFTIKNACNITLDFTY